MKSILNKKGKTSTTTTILMWGGIALIAVVFLMIFGVIPNSVNGPDSNNPQLSPGGGQIVTTGNTITIAGQDRQALGTIVTGTVTAAAKTPGSSSFTGYTTLTSGTTQYTPGTMLNIIVTNGTTYHSQIVNGYTVPAGTSASIPIMFDKNATVTEVMAYPYSGLNLNNGATPTNNITNAGANGASYTIIDTMYGTGLQSTGPMTCVIELTAGINASTSPAGIQYSGGGATPNAAYGNSAPAWYSVAGANSRVWTFDQPAISSAAGTANTLVATALPTKSFSAGSKLIKVCYTQENFVDPNTGVATMAVADSNNLVRSLAAYTFTAFFQ